MKTMYLLLFLMVCVPTFCDKNEVPILPKKPFLQARYGEALEAIFGMGIRLQVLLEDTNGPNKNFLVSPLSAAVTIGQLMLGAEGEFRDQLYYLLSLSDNKRNKATSLTIYEKDKNITYLVPYANLHVQLGNLLRALRSDGEVERMFTLEEASSFFVNNDINLNKSFEHQVKVVYNTDISRVDFSNDSPGAQKLINKWASDHTKGLISNILPTPPSPSTAAILTNAVYFYGEWETPFSDELNRNDLFNIAPTKQVDVTYMMGFIENILYAERPNYKLICLPYTNETLGMYIIMPNADSPHAYDIRAFAQSLKSRDILETIASAKKQDVVVRLPKMSLSTSLSLLEPLQKFSVYKKQNKNKVNLGSRINVVDTIEDRVNAFNAFNTTQQVDIVLTGAAQNRAVKLSGIIQQMTFSVNEKGTEAAALTATIIDYIGGSKSFIVDRPFVFFIRHEPTSAALFWGAIVDPSQSTTT